MRTGCYDCVRKHLAQASVLLDEAHLGYSHHRWLAVGHLAEAESEVIDTNPEFAAKIRETRLIVMKSQAESKKAHIEDLIIEACCLAGESDDLKYDPKNSKQFDVVNWLRKEGKIEFFGDPMPSEVKRYVLGG